MKVIWQDSDDIPWVGGFFITMQTQSPKFLNMSYYILSLSSVINDFNTGAAQRWIKL